MAKRHVPLRPVEPPEPRPPRADPPPINGSPRPDLVSIGPSGGDADEQSMREPEQPPTSKARSRRRMDRYDFIGAVIVGLLVALWVVHFLVPTPPPDNVPDLNGRSGTAQ
jgi:hypothetical protein